ncbi:MAG: sulfotransferase, partial [Arcobacteraceae bacterium]
YRFLYAYLKTANAFQDVPFSLRNLYKLIYLKYPNAKYILTIRKDVDTWFNSLESFTTKRFRLENIDVKEKLLLKDAKKLHYRYTNMPYNNFRMIWHGDKSIYFDDEALFDEDYCKYYYDKHIKEVKEFFKNKDNLLILNIEEEGAYKKLCKFLEKKSLYDEFPHLNKTKE